MQKTERLFSSAKPTILLLLILFGFLLLVMTVRNASAEPWVDGKPPTTTNDADSTDQKAGTNNTSNNEWSQPSAAPPAPVPANYQTESGADHTLIEVTDRVLVGGVKNFGINIGARDQFGAANYIKNIIPNPGFEAAELATIFLTSWGATGQRIQPDNWNLAWNNSPYQIGHPPKYWSGAEYEILSGPAKGRTGTIARFTHEDGKPTYYLDQAGRAPNGGDVVVVRHNKAGYFQKRPNGYNEADVNHVRPGSPGTQSLHLRPSRQYAAAHLLSLDSLNRDGDSSAGKMMRVQGNWHFEIWAKASKPGDELHIQFRRIGEQTFYNETVVLNENWRKISRNFFVGDWADKAGVANPSPIVLEMRIPTGSGGVWVDDAALYRVDHGNPTVFTDAYVRRLRELEPGIIRNWGEQLGSSLDNQLASPWARKTTGYSPLSQLPADYHYSLHDFLELATFINSEPWYVIPPTFSRDDLQNLIAYLSAPAGTHPYADKRVQLGQFVPWTEMFPTIHLEFGNEMWGSNAGDDQFIGATLRGGERLGQVSHDRIGIMKTSPFYQSNKIKFIIGGQARAPERQAEIMSNSRNHDTVAIAPYFATEMTNWTTDADLFLPMFAQAKQNVTNGEVAKARRIVNNYGRGTNLALYEFNAHTTFGSMPIHVRNDFVTSLGAGLALPLHMLTYQRDLGVRDQVAFTAVQYSVPMADNSGFVRLWGLLRDLEVTGRARPAWYGLDLANEAIQGNVVATQQSGKNPSWVQQPMNGIYQPTKVNYVQSFAFKTWQERSLVLFNLNLQYPEKVKLLFPESFEKATVTIKTLTGGSVRADNEIRQEVYTQEQVATLWNGYDLVLPPHSMVVLTWEQ